MPPAGLLAHFGVSSYTGVLGALQPALGGAYAGEAAGIVAAGDEAAAVGLVDRIVRGQTPGELLSLLRQARSSVPSLFKPEQKTDSLVLRGEKSFVELVIDLEQHLEGRDSEAAVIVLEEAAVLSRGVARLLRGELAVPSENRSRKARVFVARLAQIFLDPALGEFPTITHHPSSEEMSALLTLAEKRGWVMTGLFGRITLFTAAEFQNLLLGEKKGLFHPSIKVFSSDETGPPQSGMGSPLSPVSSAVALQPALSIPSLGSAVPGMEGALILVSRQMPAKTQNPNIPYALLRSVVYLHLAYGTEAHFREAAALVENISDPHLLARLFDDLRMGEGAEKNGFKNAARFFSNTAVYAGRMFAAMSADAVATIFFILHQHAHWHDQKALDQWLLLAFKAIRLPKEWAENEPAFAHLPKLSVILGTLIEWEKTREMAGRLLEEGLDLSHEASGEISGAMDLLHERHPEFAEPMAFSAGTAPVYDKERALQELGVVPPSGVLDRALSLAKGKTPWAPVFSPPPGALAGRETVFGRLRGELTEAVGESGEERGASAMAERILFSLPPADVWRLAKTVGEGREISPFGLLAAMLLNQPTEVLVAFFRAWGHGLVEDEELNPLGRTLMELWRRGDFGERLVTDVVDRALEDEGATAVLQRVLSQSGTDGEWMIAQMEIYLELSERLGAKINPYEVFATTGVLMPGDLDGRFRREALRAARKKLGGRDKEAMKMAYGVLDRMGEEGARILAAHIEARSTRTVVEANTGVSFIDNVAPARTSTVSIPLAELVEKFPLSSRAMRAWLRGKILKESRLYQREFNKYGHIDRIVSGEVQTPAVVRELAALGDEALILLKPFARGEAEILTYQTEYHGNRDLNWATERQELSPLFLPSLHLAELIGTPAAHQILADLYEQIKTHRETEVRARYFSAEHPIPQTPLRLIVRALARMGPHIGDPDPAADAETFADFMCRYPNLVESSLAFGALVKIAEEDVEDVGKKIAEVWERHDVPIGTLMALRTYVPLWNAILGNLTSPPLYWQLLRGSQSPITVPIHDVVQSIALNEDPANHQRGIAIKTLFWCYREVSVGAALVGASSAPDETLKTLYTSGLAARYADPEDVTYFEAVFVKGPQ